MLSYTIVLLYKKNEAKCEYVKQFWYNEYKTDLWTLQLKWVFVIINMFVYIISTYIAKMLVNIDLYIREKLFNDDDDIQCNTINGHTETIMSTIYNYMHDNKITRI